MWGYLLTRAPSLMLSLSPPSGPLPPPACLTLSVILEFPYPAHQRLHGMLQGRHLPLQLLVLRLKLHGLHVHHVILRL